MPEPTVAGAGFKTYLVGGAVRDKLLGRQASDRDYVVVGATPQAMQAAGFKAVGKDFPVFLHPDTNEEFALARTERKTGHGYHGFAFHAAPTVTLEEDLARRDFTINAMAEDAAGQLVDPFGGHADLEARILRHVSPAFVEDPVRVLRAARFLARLAPLGFCIADDTRQLMRQMVAAGEVDHLVPERVWAELHKALGEPEPSAFVRALRDCGALQRILPEVDALYGVPQTEKYHPEIDTGRHVEMVLDMAAHLAPGDRLVGFCALVHDLGKARTPEAEWPAHRAHEQRGLKPLAALAARLRVPTDYHALAKAVCAQHLNCHRALELRPATVLKLLEALDALRRPERLAPFLLACEADKRGRLHHQQDAYPQADFLRRAHAAASAVQARPFVAQGLQGPAIGQAVRRERIRAIATLST